MENLSLDEKTQGGSSAGQVLGSITRQPNPQLPPQLFTTAEQLLGMTDKEELKEWLGSCCTQKVDSETILEKLMVALRDGRKLIGTLRSWDQFANLVLQSTVERIFVPPTPINPNSSIPVTMQPGLFADIPRGVFLVRGENVSLLGEIDLDKDDDIPPGYEMGEIEVVQKIAEERKLMKAEKDKTRSKKLKKLGFETEIAGEFSI